MRGIWAGEHGVLLEADFVESCETMPDNSAGLILCDLPYGTTANAWDAVIPFDLLWKQFRRIARASAAIVLTAQTPFDKALGASNLAELRYEWVWVKNKPTGGLNAKRMPMKGHENILVFYREAPIYNPQKTAGVPYRATNGYRESDNQGGGTSHPHILSVSNERYPVSTLFIPREDARTHTAHPTQKPVALMEYLIKTYTDPGDMVFDPTAGSGTVAIAARNTGRQFCVSDKDPFWAAEIGYRLRSEDQRSWAKAAKVRRAAWSSSLFGSTLTSSVAPSPLR